MKRLAHSMYAYRDAAVVITCAIGFVFAVFVLPALEDNGPQVVAQANK